MYQTYKRTLKLDVSSYFIAEILELRINVVNVQLFLKKRYNLLKGNQNMDQEFLVLLNLKYITGN